MSALTAAEVLALSILAEGRPLTNVELHRALADLGMHLDDRAAGATLQTLAAADLAERTCALQLGKYRITPQGRAWLRAHTSAATA